MPQNLQRKFVFTKEQKYIFDELKQFTSNNLNFLIIQGSAGSGKTFLISNYVKYLEQMGIKFVLLAPTGRAARILSEKTNNEAKTIHKEIYNLLHTDLIFDESETHKKDVEINEIKTYFALKLSSDSNTIFIIDESSMIHDNKNSDISDNDLIFGSGKLLSDLVEYVKNGESNKIIFVGDEYQLPPVGSSQSPALDKEYIEKKFNLKGKKLYLTKVVRQKDDSTVLKNANIIKSSIENNELNHLELVYSNDFVKVDNLIEHFDISNIHSNIILCSKNEKALRYNYFIREKMNFSNKLEIGEILLNVKNTYYNDKVIFNGEFLKVVKILNYEVIPQIPINKEKYIKLEFYDVKLKNLSSNEYLTRKILANSLDSKTTGIEPKIKKALYTLVISKIPENKRKSKEYILEVLRNDPYYNSLHVKYGYAITTHKAQGGEWENVFIDPEYYSSTFSKEYFQWLYTSITRSRKKIFITELPFEKKFFSKLKLENKNNFSIKDNINMSVEYGSNNLHFPDHFLRNLFERFKRFLEPHNFKICKVQHFNYQEVYFIKKLKNYLKIQIFYNKQFIPTYLKILEATNEIIAKEFLSIFNKKSESINAFEAESSHIENAKCVKIYIDGSYENRLKKFGAGIVVIRNQNVEKYWKVCSKSDYLKHRNVAGEILAALLAFEYARQEKLNCIEINYDYTGIEKWALSLWRAKTNLTKLYKKQYEYYSKFFKIKFTKVKAHSNDKLNELADILAKKAILENSSHIKYDINI
ncbi:AAA family ATPase [Thermosipho ferrireducens]|uniref:AAA family ATPase n=1 Tax=Thermosipho ferrireducens TaxID=2571116 RepID=A0ABX7SB76_9BACT|nr:AAA family ATPase [Thermosipho ferrireducens]QTA38625.1 AAA family ATPase [Thermosipho ferrireducens]